MKGPETMDKTNKVVGLEAWGKLVENIGRTTNLA